MELSKLHKYVETHHMATRNRNDPPFCFVVFFCFSFFIFFLSGFSASTVGGLFAVVEGVFSSSGVFDLISIHLLPHPLYTDFFLPSRAVAFFFMFFISFFLVSGSSSSSSSVKVAPMHNSILDNNYHIPINISFFVRSTDPWFTHPNALWIC